jgi:ABC-type dipeptide/oligopeptide/nickel transport system ATPase component
MSSLITVKNLKIFFPENAFTAVNGISFNLKEGEITALVGESGSGKSLTASAILGLAPINAQVSGEIYYKDQSLTPVFPKDVRGNHISLIPQDTLSSLNPVFKVGGQIAEAVKIHQKALSNSEVKALVISRLAEVGIADPVSCYEAYPHEISGGMRQRAMIAMAIINEPDLIIADEATTALDVTVQATIIRLLKDLNKTILFITHDLGVVAEIADQVIVMRHGNIVEKANVYDLFEKPAHEYTRDLLTSMPRV